MFGIDRLTRQMEAGFADLRERIAQMPSQAEFDQAIQGLKQAITDAASRVSNDIAALRQQLAAGNPITDADLQALQEATTAVAQIDAPGG